MPVACALFENNRTSGPDDYAATVQISGSADGNDDQPFRLWSDIVEVTAQG